MKTTILYCGQFYTCAKLPTNRALERENTCVCNFCKSSFLSKIYKKIIENSSRRSLKYKTINVSSLELEKYRLSTNFQGQFREMFDYEPESYIFVFPEHNKNIPFNLKWFIDICTPDMFKGKNILIVSTHGGRAENQVAADVFSRFFSIYGSKKIFKASVSKYSSTEEEIDSILEESILKLTV